MTFDDLIDSVTDFAASEQMRTGRSPEHGVHMVSRGGLYRVAVIIDDVRVVHEDADTLYRAVKAAGDGFAEWARNYELLDKSLRAVRGSWPGNLNGEARRV